MAWRQALPRIAAATSAPCASLALCEAQRKTDYDLARHQHGKTRVRVLKVRREGGVHAISEYKVETTLFSPAYDRVFTKGDNTDLAATDTQKNTVYIVAKRTDASTPEAFGVALCEHLLKEYPILSGCRADVESVEWARACVDGRNGAQPHVHGFLRSEPERQKASVSMTRGQGPKVESAIEGLVVLKTTQSGFEGYLKDKYTLLPDTQERCMATEMTASWNYAQLPQDFGAARNNVRRQILKGFFGEPSTGVYSASLQESIYDAGCLVLDAVPEVKQIEIDTPNLHYLPAKLLDAVGEKFEDDVFIPTSEPSGSINCIVARGAGGRPTTTAPTSGPKLSPKVETKPVSLNVADAQARAMVLPAKPRHVKCGDALEHARALICSLASIVLTDITCLRVAVPKTSFFAVRTCRRFESLTFFSTQTRRRAYFRVHVLYTMLWRRPRRPGGRRGHGSGRGLPLERAGTAHAAFVR